MAQNPRVGVGVLILKGGKVLLGRRHEDPKKADSELHGEGTWTLPGGKVEFGEKLAETCVREVFEETGLKITENALELINVSDDILPDAHFVTAGFLCRDFEGEPKVLEPDEITEWKWFSIERLPKPLFGPSRKLLEAFISRRDKSELV
jgi:mutator protein MutT